MRQLTFKGYLKNYVRRLSAQNTNNLHRLAAEASKNYRLQEPLLLYASSTGKLNYLLRAIDDDKLRNKYMQIASIIGNSDDTFMIFEKNLDRLDAEYHKVYHSYVSRRDRPVTTLHTKRRIRERIQEAQQAQGITNGQICTSLKLDVGNVNAFINQSRLHRLSMENLDRIMDYLGM